MAINPRNIFLLGAAPLVCVLLACGAGRQQAARVCTAACESGDCRNGRGVYRHADCGVYEGTFRDGRREGTGSFVFPDGDRFFGTYSGGRRKGEGRYSFANGNEFQGGFSSARFEPPQTIRFADGGALRGSFVREAARLKRWSRGELPEVQAYGYLRRPDGSERLCAASGRSLLCDTEAFPGQLTGTSLGTPARERFLLVLYTADDTSIRRRGQSEPGRSGMVLRPGDRIEAGRYSIEIQAAGGTVLRLKPGSLLSIPLDFGRSGLLHLERGGILVRTGKGAKQGRSLRVRSGGTIYAVNGTEFSVETDDTGRISRVKVFSGEILLSPDVPALRRFTPEEIRNTPALKKIIERIENKPLPVRPGETAGLSAAGRRWTQTLDRALETQELEAVQELLNTRPGTAAEKEKFKETPQEKSERRLLTNVSEDRFNAAADGARKTGRVPAEVSDEISLEYEENLNRNADDLSSELSRESSASNLEDLKRIYSTLEVITFVDGKKKAGSVVAQVGGLLILHSTDGVFRAKIDEIRYVDFYHQSDDKSETE